MRKSPQAQALAYSPESQTDRRSCVATRPLWCFASLSLSGIQLDSARAPSAVVVGIAALPGRGSELAGAGGGHGPSMIKITFSIISISIFMGIVESKGLIADCQTKRMIALFSLPVTQRPIPWERRRRPST